MERRWVRTVLVEDAGGSDVEALRCPPAELTAPARSTGAVRAEVELVVVDDDRSLAATGRLPAPLAGLRSTQCEAR